MDTQPFTDLTEVAREERLLFLKDQDISRSPQDLFYRTEPSKEKINHLLQVLVQPT